MLFSFELFPTFHHVKALSVFGLRYLKESIKPLFNNFSNSIRWSSTNLPELGIDVHTSKSEIAILKSPHIITGLM